MGQNCDLTQQVFSSAQPKSSLVWQTALSINRLPNYLSGLLFGGEIDGGSGYGAPSSSGFDPFGFVGGIAGGFTGDNLIGTGYNTPQTG